MEDKIEKLLEERGQDIKEEWEEMTKTRISSCESPIEKLFLIEWCYQTELYADYENFLIKPQYKIGDYRVDFLVYYKSLEHKEWSLIVEIDSHIWHGSKPEQFAKEKKRERELKKEGYNLMRFSGREIYRNVKKCVEEVLEYLSNIENNVLEKEIEEYEKDNLK